MENQLTDAPEVNTMADMPQKPDITMPVVALALDFSPVLFIFIATLHDSLYGFALIGILIPVIGVLTGIAALCHGRKRIGIAGIVLSVIAIALPIICVITVISLFKPGAVVTGM